MCWITELSVLLGLIGWTVGPPERTNVATHCSGSSAVAVGQKPVATCHIGLRIDKLKSPVNLHPSSKLPSLIVKLTAGPS